jgi:RNA polymerase sigma factor for flagellar operon FliA
MRQRSLIPPKQVTFSSYAKHRIKGAILDSLRQLDWASRDMRRRFKRVEQAVRELMLALGREPVESEIAAKLGMSVEEWRQVSLELQQIEIISADTRAVEFDDCPQIELVDRGEDGPDASYHRGEMKSALREALGTLPDRYRQVMQLYYTEELTMKEIGGMMGINESRVSQIHKAALEKLQLTLVANGITRRHALAG